MQSIGPLLTSLCLLCWGGDSLAITRVAVGVESANLLQIEDNRLVGRIGALYQCVFDRVDRDFEFVGMPIKRADYLLRNREIDVVIPLAKLSARDEHADFAGALAYAEYVFVSLREIPDISTGADLRYVLLRGFAGNRFVYELLGASLDDRPLEVSSWQQVSGLLERGRADVTVMPRQDVGAITAGDIHTQPAGRIPASLYVSRKPENRQLLTLLRVAVGECHEKYAEHLDNL